MVLLVKHWLRKGSVQKKSDTNEYVGIFSPSRYNFFILCWQGKGTLK